MSCSTRRVLIRGYLRSIEGTREMMDLLIFPFGGNARESLSAIMAQNRVEPTWNVLGFIDDDMRLLGRECCGVPMLGDRSVLAGFPSARVLAVPGNADNFLGRAGTIGLLDVPLERHASIVDPSVRMAPDAKIGKNTLLMANVVISPGVEIGHHCVILPNTVISHDTRIGDYSLIGSNVSISGSCTIGHTCYIGSGTRVKDHLTIEPECLVGIGSCVVRDVLRRTVVAGNPAHRMRHNE